MQFIQEHWKDILGAVGAFYAFATIVAALTPTDKDDSILAKIGALADRFGLKLKGK